MSTEESKRKKCGTCKVNLLETEYNIKRNGTLNSACNRCLDVRRKYRAKKRDERLSDSSSDNFKRKPDGTIYVSCISGCSLSKKYMNEKYRCAHNARKDRCKKCNDPVQVTINQMIRDSKKEDKLHKRYDPVNFIDKCFLENLIDNCEDKCTYCQTPLQYTEYGHDTATLERLDNSIGHIKSNCTIACLTCNLSH